MPRVSTQQLGKIFLFWQHVICPGINKGLSLFMCSLDHHGGVSGFSIWGCMLKPEIWCAKVQQCPSAWCRCLSAGWVQTGPGCQLSPFLHNQHAILEPLASQTCLRKMWCLPHCTVRRGWKRPILRQILFLCWLFKKETVEKQATILVPCASEC